MPRKLRVEYPGAIYHVMNRGDRREPIFMDAYDRQRFLDTLGEACVKADWQAHSWCLMPNHFHLVVETPAANLVAGMRWFLGTYTTRFNQRHRLSGHLFSGRYKSLIVDGSGDGYLKTVCDYVHLNPVRAGLLKPGEPLRDFRWSSWPDYLRSPGKRPPWLRVDRLLGEYRLSQDSLASRRNLERELEQRRGSETNAHFKTIRRGWYFGEESLKRELLEKMSEQVGAQNYGEERRESGEEKARRIIALELKHLRWTDYELVHRPKGDLQKVRIARRLRAETTMTLKWIARELRMGVWTHVSNLLSRS